MSNPELPEFLLALAEIGSVSNIERWTMEDSPDHREPVPLMPAVERVVWSGLANLGRNALSKEGAAMLDALERKLRYRAEREVDTGEE
jgi:hypothetical protein